ncbi:hypothetical protein NP493_109g02008 [Ridgeia piscesae]|uniref:2-hydroxyacyl-CoA lyase 2 n=1 Tax=Ridgeia piscesae TaxID=27915 RepID=A0AAD9P6Y9_RIDPI|nr:hypothetical protein NP493_109g02008 [Ridgeia piscesae]
MNGAAMTELIRDFLSPALFYKRLADIDIDFFCGVPDSLLKDFCAYVTDNTPTERHVITANEGNAVSLAVGYHMATKRSALVYLQNSGLGNVINPLLSLADRDVYRIPMLLLVGWRGEPGKKDEPQHRVQGQLTAGLLASLHIPFQILPDYDEGAQQALQAARHHMDSTSSPYCLLVKRQIFTPYKKRLPKTMDMEILTREGALRLVGDALGDRDVVVGTTGMLSRELFEYRVARGHGHEKDFLTVGSMGHASSIALGIAQQKPHRQVYCFDGDGAAIMHLGAWATVGQSGNTNFKHIVFNNGVHESVGAQPTAAMDMTRFSFKRIAEAVGYKMALVATTKEEIVSALQALKQAEGPALLELRVRIGHRKDLGRPTRTPVENKQDIMTFLADD